MTTENIKVIKENLKTARDRQKSYANILHRVLEFEIGDKVFLKLLPWKRSNQILEEEEAKSTIHWTL